MRSPFLSFLLIAFSLLFGCRPSVHKMGEVEVIPLDRLEPLLYDIHKAEGMAELDYARYGTPDFKQEHFLSLIQEHGYSKEQFDSSMVFYGRDLSELIALYDRIINKFKALRDTIQLYSGSSERTSPAGDSVVLWRLKENMPLRSYANSTETNYFVNGDANFVYGDRFYLHLFTSGKGSRMADSTMLISAALGVVMANDSLCMACDTVRYGEKLILYVESDSVRSVSSLFASVIIPKAYGFNSDVVIDSVMLFRVHRVKAEVKDSTTVAADSLSVLKDTIPTETSAM